MAEEDLDERIVAYHPETGNTALLVRRSMAVFAARGWEVATGIPLAVAAVTAPEEYLPVIPADLSGMKKDELLAVARKLGLDLPGNTNKESIIEAIEATASAIADEAGEEK